MALEGLMHIGHTRRAKRIVLFLLLSFAVLPGFELNSAPPDVEASDLEFRRSLGKLAYENGDMNSIEEKYLKLAEDYSSSNALGRIYAELAARYGYRPWKDYPKIILYCEKALALPLEPDHKCRTYMLLGEAIAVNLRTLEGGPQQAARKEATTAFLRGLQYVFSKVATLERKAVPGISMVSALGTTNDPGYNAIVAANRAETKAHTEAIEHNMLVDWGQAFKEKIVILYSGCPEYADEIVTLGKQILPGNPVLTDLVKAVKARHPPKTYDSAP